jgi:hypothetical protein
MIVDRTQIFIGVSGGRVGMESLIGEKGGLFTPDQNKRLKRASFFFRSFNRDQIFSGVSLGRFPWSRYEITTR